MKSDRRKAHQLMPTIRWMGEPLANAKLGKCMREYFTISFRDEHGVTQREAYNYSGHYIGRPTQAHRLAKRGIMPELADPEHSTCSIGRSHKDGRYYGWSHRAISGFKRGSQVREGDCAEEYLPVGFQAATEEDKREMAVAFARSVS